MSKEGKITLDAADIRILRILQRDASLPIAEIAREANLSQTPCWRRIKRLKDEKIVAAISARIDREALGLNFVAYAFVKLAVPSRDNMQRFDTMVNIWPEVVMCERITGAVDYLIKVVSTDIKGYDEFLRDKLLDLAIVSDVQSRIVVSTIKDEHQLPIDDSMASQP